MVHVSCMGVFMCVLGVFVSMSCVNRMSVLWVSPIRDAILYGRLEYFMAVSNRCLV